MTWTNQLFKFVRYNRVFVITEFVITEFDCMWGCVSVCVSVCVCVRAFVCMCLCVREKERVNEMGYKLQTPAVKYFEDMSDKFKLNYYMTGLEMSSSFKKWSENVRCATHIWFRYIYSDNSEREMEFHNRCINNNYCYIWL